MKINSKLECIHKTAWSRGLLILGRGDVEEGYEPQKARKASFTGIFFQNLDALGGHLL